MKRKSLLVAMAAMSLAAIGAGSVSTLAWYTASVQSKVSSAVYESGAVTTKETEISLDGVTIVFSIATVEDVQLSNLATYESTANTLMKGMVSGNVNTTTGAVTNGTVTSVPIASNEVGNFVKAYEVTATFAENTEAAKISSLAGYKVEATVTANANGYAKLRDDQTLTGADATSHTLTVSFDGSSTISVTGERYVRIQAKETGATQLDLESDHENDTLSIAALANVTPTEQ